MTPGSTGSRLLDKLNLPAKSQLFGNLFQVVFLHLVVGVGNHIETVANVNLGVSIFAILGCGNQRDFTTYDSQGA